MIFLLKACNVRKIWAVILGMLASGRKARNYSLPCWTVNHMWEAKKRVLMWWRLTCGNEAVEFKTCHNIARVSRLLGRLNKKIKMHSGLKKNMWGSGRAGNSCEYNVGLIRVSFWNLIDGFKSGLPHQHLSLSLSLSPAFSCFLSFLHLKLADGYIIEEKKTNSWKMILLCRARVPLLFSRRSGWVFFFLRVIFCFTSRTNGTGKV